MGSVEDFIYKINGSNGSVRGAYKRIFNSKEKDSDGRKILDDLMVKFRFYGSKPTTDYATLAKQAAYRELIEYILAMSARLSDDTISEIELFINSK